MDSTKSEHEDPAWSATKLTSILTLMALVLGRTRAALSGAEFIEPTGQIMILFIFGMSGGAVVVGLESWREMLTRDASESES
jgi:hypothetical protein